MEYVPGLPITEYCDKHRLSMRERLELFMQVCDGVQHAHQKGDHSSGYEAVERAGGAAGQQGGAEDH